VPGRGELFRALGALTERPAGANLAVVGALGLPEVPGDDAHAEVFLFQLYPYASVYVGAEGMLGGEACDRVAGFWRALGFEPPAEPDHLAPLLWLYADLIERQHEARDEAGRRKCFIARKALLWEHLLCWLPGYLDGLNQIAPPTYAQWGEVLRAALIEEAHLLGPQDRLPLHLRAAPDPPDSWPEREAFFSWLLAPVRSGMVLVRADLQRAAEEIGLGIRVSNRRLALESLLGQEPDRVLAWLAAEARRWAALHEGWIAVTGQLATFWRTRAEAAEALILESVPDANADCGTQDLPPGRPIH
jgi:hypothetical protein